MARFPSLNESLPGLWHMLRYFWPWVRRQRGLIAASLVVLFLGILLRLAEPWPLKFILDRVIPAPADRPGGMHSLPFIDDMSTTVLATVLAIAVVVITSLRAFTDYFHKIGFAKVGNRVLRKVRDKVFVHLQKLSLSFHDRARSGDLIIRVTRDVSMLRDVMATAVIPLFANVLVVLGMAAVMLLLEWRLALLAMATAPFFWYTTTKLSKSIHGAARKQRMREGKMASTAADSITAIRSVQALSLEEVFAEEFSGSSAKSQKEDMKTARLSARLERSVDVMLAITTALVLWFGVGYVVDARMTPGDLVVFLAYLKRAFRPAKDFAKYSARLAKATAAGERVMALLDRVPDVRDLPGAVAAPPLTGAVRFEGVSFQYDDKGPPVLDAIDLSVKPGQCVALVGPSGIGKSTLVSLIMRLYDPTEGRVTIDGRDLRDYTLASLRPQIAAVLQDTILFAGSVSENISYGMTDATPEQIEAAARLANAHEFIENLPDGYDAIIGERGETLSRGQRQRISIARAVMRDAPLLIFDEPTTGLDDDNKEIVTAALGHLARGRTTFLITHDREVAAGADIVMHLEDGRLR